MGVVVGIDTGGTFTDMVVFDPATGYVDSLKTSSTPSTPAGRSSTRSTRRRRRGRDRHVHARDDRGNERADRAHGLPGRVRHDEGLRGHALHPADQPQGAHDLRWTKPAPLVASRRLCLGLEERLDSEGNEVKAVDEARGARSSPRRIRDPAPRRWRCACLFSYVSTDHEDRVKAILTEELPGVPISVSPRSRRSGASTSDRRRRSPTPTCGRSSAATSGASTGRSATRA